MNVPIYLRAQLRGAQSFPAPTEVLQNGDIVNFDITLEENGYIADSSKTYMVGTLPPLARRLVQVTYEAMWKGIKAVRPGARLGNVGHAIERHARRNGCSVVRKYCGHGIGREMHEPPQGLHWGKPQTGLVLQEGVGKDAELSWRQIATSARQAVITV